RGVKEVQVITRRQFEDVLKVMAEEQGAGEAQTQKSSIQKRVELLLIEIERLRRDKSELEHLKGLLETERAELSGRLDAVLTAGSKAFGEKITIEDISHLITGRDQLKVDLDGLKIQSELARERYEEEITNLRVTQTELEANRDKLLKDLDDSRQDGQRLKSDLEASRTLAANHKRKTLERDSDIVSLKERIELLEAELESEKALVAERDQEIETLKNPPEPEVEEEEAKPSRSGTSRLSTREPAAVKRPATRRLNRGRTASKEGSAYDFSFNSGKQRSSGRSTNRRRRLG
ncbi:MAG: hypothetical protein P1V97_19275, partial [Planctomycetota bacterium]|nr:hypothetical protein [Planctomycetota bacterium]